MQNFFCEKKFVLKHKYSQLAICRVQYQLITMSDKYGS